jgi:hypothetical protein
VTHRGNITGIHDALVHLAAVILARFTTDAWPWPRSRATSTGAAATSSSGYGDVIWALA